ncbi:hypothetical protein ACFX12_037616 [Malus domestica]
MISVSLKNPQPLRDKPASTSLDPPRSSAANLPRVLIQLLSSVNPPPFHCQLHRYSSVGPASAPASASSFNLSPPSK